MNLTPEQLANIPAAYRRQYMNSKTNAPAQSPQQYAKGGTSNFNESAGGGVRFNGDGSIYKPSAPAPAREAPRTASGKKITSVKIPDAYYNQMMMFRRPQAGMAQAKPSVPNTVSGSGNVKITNSRGEQPSVGYANPDPKGIQPDIITAPDKSIQYVQNAVDAGLMAAPPTRAEAIRQQEAAAAPAPAAPAAPAPAPRVEQFAVGPQQAPVKAITNRGGNARAGALRSAAADSSRSRIAAQNQGA